MLRSLFGRTLSREEVERDATQQIESLARSGSHPPPAEWTLLGGLPEAEAEPAMPVEAVTPASPRRAASKTPSPKKKRASSRKSA